MAGTAARSARDVLGPADVKGGNPAGKIRVADLSEPGRAQLVREIILVGKAADRLDEILIAVAILGDVVTQLRHHIEGPGIIRLLPGAAGRTSHR